MVMVPPPAITPAVVLLPFGLTFGVQLAKKTWACQSTVDLVFAGKVRDGSSRKETPLERYAPVPPFQPP